MTCNTCSVITIASYNDMHYSTVVGVCFPKRAVCEFRSLLHDFFCFVFPAKSTTCAWLLFYCQTAKDTKNEKRRSRKKKKQKEGRTVRLHVTTESMNPIIVRHFTCYILCFM